jgi:ribosomal protein S18 acetylase RimI-like enzyme
MRHGTLAVRILSPTTENEWHHAEILMAELKEWDVQQSQGLGFDRDEVIRVFYSDDTGDIRRDSVPPDGCLLLAMDGSLPAGCAAFRRLSSSACELYNVYVRQACRGRKIGSMLVQRLVSDAKSAGYRTMCLETAAFMHDAHNLYRSLRFQVREPYRGIPAKFAKATMWMECKLCN